MNNAPIISNASLSLSSSEIESLIPSCKISFRRITNCLRLPETLAASAGVILVTSGSLAIHFAIPTLGLPFLITGVVTGLAALFSASLIIALKNYHRESPSSLADLELQTIFNPVPEQNTPPPTYEECRHFFNTPLPTYEECHHFFNTPPPTYEESCMPPQPSPSPTNEEDSSLLNTPPALQFTYPV